MNETHDGFTLSYKSLVVFLYGLRGKYMKILYTSSFSRTGYKPNIHHYPSIKHDVLRHTRTLLANIRQINTSYEPPNVLCKCQNRRIHETIVRNIPFSSEMVLTLSYFPSHIPIFCHTSKFGVIMAKTCCVFMTLHSPG